MAAGVVVIVLGVVVLVPECLLLLNQRSLGRPYHPAAVAFDESVGEAGATLKSNALIIFPAHVIDARNNRHVSFDPRV
jgi:hypothetical protein